jgi:hypothetical protein
MMRVLIWLIGYTLTAGSMIPPVYAEDVIDERISAVAISDNDLDGVRGRETVPPILNDMDLTADLHDNSLISSATGSNTISDGAFTGATGFVTVIQNTGNQVIIQDSTIINLTLN